MSTKHLIVLCGLPGSGKTTYRNGPAFDDYKVCSTDDIIEAMAAGMGKTYSQAFAECIEPATKLMNENFARYLKNGDNIIFDQTNLSPKKRRAIVSQVPKDYEKTLVAFETDSASLMKIWLERKELGNKIISLTILNDMQSNYIKPTQDEPYDNIVVVERKNEDKED